MITYSNSLQAADLEGFLAHWDFRPPEGTLLAMLKQSTEVILARDASTSTISGYVAALSDRVACGYISALEVRPEFRGRGIGTALQTQITARLGVYGVSLSCAPTVAAFYTSRGFTPVAGMSRRKKPSRANDA